MAILYQAAAARRWRRVALVATGLTLGVALAWLLRSGRPELAPTRSVAVASVGPADVASRASAGELLCDARCAAAKVLVPATTACAISVEELATFGVRWMGADSASPKFDRFAWLEPARGTLTLGGEHAEVRNASGAYLPVEYDCDFDPATLAVIEARLRPRAAKPVVAIGPASP